MYSNNPYAQGGWYNPQNAHSINSSPWCPNALHPPTFGALPPAKTYPSILKFEFSAFQPDILNSVVTGPDNREFFTIRTPTPSYTVIYKTGTPFCIITWRSHPIVEAEGILSRQRTGDFLRLAADNRWGTSFAELFGWGIFILHLSLASHRSMTVNDTGKVYVWIPRGTDLLVCYYSTCIIH